MRAVVAPEPGGPEALRVVEVDVPVPGPGEVLVRVAASAVNRADVIQRQGHYPPPEGAGPVLGLEISGQVEALGPGTTGPAVGDRVMAVLASGGYAQCCVVPAGCLLPVPAGVDLIEAAAIPEVFTTVYDNLLLRGRLAAGEVALIHGASSGIGTAAVQVARRAGARVVVTASSAAKLALALTLGAERGVVYGSEDFVAAARSATDGRGVDVVLDVVGASYLARNLDALAVEGRLVVIGLQGGARAELDLGVLLRRRLSVAGSTLRARATAEKVALAARIRSDLLPGFDGPQPQLRPIVDRVLPLEAVAEAHRILESGQHIGKIVLRVDP